MRAWPGRGPRGCRWMIRSGQAAYGRFMLRTGHLPTRDTWSWTVHGHGLVVSAWLFDLLLGVAARGGGESAAVPLAFCLLMGGACTACAEVRVMLRPACWGWRSWWCRGSSCCRSCSPLRRSPPSGGCWRGRGCGCAGRRRSRCWRRCVRCGSTPTARFSSGLPWWCWKWDWRGGRGGCRRASVSGASEHTPLAAGGLGRRHERLS